MVTDDDKQKKCYFISIHAWVAMQTLSPKPN